MKERIPVTKELNELILQHLIVIGEYTASIIENEAVENYQECKRLKEALDAYIEGAASGYFDPIFKDTGVNIGEVFLECKEEFETSLRNEYTLNFGVWT